ncbi:MAG: DUF4249 domain-containing protein [Thermonemataceae bacterium]
MKSAYKVILFSLCGLLILTSCEDVIDVDLDQGEVLLAVDGVITDQPLPQRVRLTTTAPYFENESAPVVTNATVVLTDSEGNTETLTNMGDGNYEIRTIQGIVGNSYFLTINYEGETYEASTAIRPVPPIDSVLVEDDEIADEDEEGLYIFYYGQELPTENDHYRIKLYRDDELLNTPEDLIYIRDEFVDGNYIQDIQLNDEPFQSGENVRVEFLSITEDNYEFYVELDNQINNGGLFANPPANVKTNIRNVNPEGRPAVGYFGGSAISSLEGVLTENGQVIK